MSGMNLKSATVPPDGAAQKLPAQAQSQTLSRGIRVLELLSDTQSPLTIAEISERSGLHRSIAYRILRTLEDHSLVARDESGKFQCGPGLAALARGVARDLQSAALPELTALAGHLQMTAFIAVWDQRQCVTLVAVEPPHGEGTLVQRPGTRHSFSAGAPGIAIQSALSEEEWETLAPGRPYREESRAAAQRGYALSRDEVIPGVSSVGAPIRVPGQLPAALAVVYLRSDLSGDEVGARVRTAAAAIEDALR